MSSNDALSPELFAELVGDIDGLSIEVLYLCATKALIRKVVTECDVPRGALYASVNQRLKALGRTVEPRHVQTVLNEQKMDIAASFQGRAPPMRVHS